MNRALAKRTITYGILAALLFAVLFLLTFRDRTAVEAPGAVELVAFGDSVFGEVRDETAIPALIGEKLGRSVFNAGMGGTGIARTEADRRLDYPRASLSMTGLSKAIYAGDFGVQQSGEFRESMMEYFPEVIEGLRTLDFSKVEIVLIQQGINDYHAGVPLENPENPYDEYTFLGALRSSVEALKKVNPDLRIVLVTPSYTWYPLSGQSCEELDNGGGVLEEYVNAEINLARELGLEVIDLYHECWPDFSQETCERYTRDGVHPNEAGRALWAEKIVAALGQ